MILLAPRKTALAMMRWRDLDLEAGVWTTPPEFVKQTTSTARKSRRVYRTPLPAPARQELDRLPRGLPDERVFGEVPITRNLAGRPHFVSPVLARKLAANGAPPALRWHRFRHTLATDVRQTCVVHPSLEAIREDRANPAALKTFLKAEAKKWADIIKEAGVQAEWRGTGPYRPLASFSMSCPMCR